MTILLLIVALTFTAWALVAMVRPFLASRQHQMSFELLDQELRQIEALVARKVALVQALRDIEYDFKTNKISREDYERFKRSCERQAVGVMRRLNAIHGGDTDWGSQIDEAVRNKLDGAGPEAIAALEGEPEQKIQTAPTAALTEEDEDKLECGHCGKSLTEDDLFCSRCGAPTDTDESAEPGPAVAGADPREEQLRPAEVTG